MSKTCEECRYWNGDSGRVDTKGNCLQRSPVVMRDMLANRDAAVFPPRAIDAVACGDFKPLESDPSPRTPPGIPCPRCGTWQQEPSEDTAYRCWKCQYDWLKTLAVGDEVKIEDYRAVIDYIGLSGKDGQPPTRIAIGVGIIAPAEESPHA